MKVSRILEFICVPLALACVGWYAIPLAAKLIGMLGHQYITTTVAGVFPSVLRASACGLAAGVAAVISQKGNGGRGRWSFYALLAFSVPVGAALILVIEAVRPRGEGAFGFPAASPNITSVPFWILAVGFWLPFLILLRRKEPNKALEPTTTAVTPPAAQESRRP